MLAAVLGIMSIGWVFGQAQSTIHADLRSDKFEIKVMS